MFPNQFRIFQYLQKLLLAFHRQLKLFVDSLHIACSAGDHMAFKIIQEMRILQQTILPLVTHER